MQARAVCRTLITAIVLIVAPCTAHAWDNHAVGSMVALKALPEAQATVTAEPLEAFLGAERDAISRELAGVDAWARGKLFGYPETLLPPLGAEDAGDAKALRAGFCRALRINPRYAFAQMVQRLGPEATGAPLPPIDVTLLPKSISEGMVGFAALPTGAPAPAWLVAASAADEPDFGLDIGLFADNGTTFGKTYGFGAQPFGNPVFEFSSAAPFHMGFYFESPILYTAAPFLKRAFPELRLKQYMTLSRLAFRTGHAYWGWRFAGYGLHYAQDLTQPYHTIVFPNMSIVHLMWVNAKDLLGYSDDKTHLVQIVNNRHLALENYLYMRLNRWLANPDTAPTPAVAALADASHDAAYPAYTDDYPRNVIAAEAHAKAAEVDQVLTRYLPVRLVADPDYIFGLTEPGVDVARILAEGPPEADERMARLSAEMAASFGAHSRNYVRGALTGATP